MPFSVRCWRPPAGALAAVTILLTGCAAGSSERWTGFVCPAVVDYSRDEQRRVADAVAALPDGSVIIDWLTDYAVLRAQLDDCR